MAAPNANTFSLPSPRRPGSDDFNGIAKEDDQEFPPDPQTQPNADEWNTIEYVTLALGRVCPLLVLSLNDSFAYVGSASPNENLTFSAFTIAVNGTGDVSITWPANTLPASSIQPIAALNSGPGMIEAAQISNGVRVKTYDQTGAAASKAFTVSLY